MEKRKEYLYGVRGWPFLHTTLIREMHTLFGQEI